ncbi:MAG: hypothetical protein JNK82_23475, partial [Myxococcaceae bacterium]|nr:hypothetical protein [Myxococcaceae bacterium]
ASGLAGAADADADGTVRFGELAAFVAFHTERMFGQRPWFEAPGGDLRAPVLELKGRTGLVLDANLGGRLRVRAVPSSHVVAELHKPVGLPATLVLPPGAYRIERATDAAEVDVPELGQGRVDDRLFVPAAVAERGGDELDGFQSPFSSDVVNALSAGYQSGVQTSQRGPWRHAIDLAYALDPVPFGILTAEHGVELGYRYSLGRFFAGARAGFHQSTVLDVALRRGGLLLEGGARFVPGPFELQPHVGLGVHAVVRVQGGVTRGDLTAPLVVMGLRLELPMAAGFSLVADARGELIFLALDGARTPFVSPLVTLGVSWRR